MGETVSFYGYNILESGTVTISPSGAEDTGYPLTRLYDRSFNLLWKHTGDGGGGDDFGFDDDDFGFGDDDFGFDSDMAGSNYTITIDQGGETKAVALFAVAGHNFAGKQIRLEYSTDGGTNWTSVLDFNQPDNSMIVETFASVSAADWRVVIENPTNPQAAEIWLGSGYTFNVMAQNPLHAYAANVDWSRSIGGQESGIKLGETEVRRSYILRISNGDLANLQSFISQISEFAYPFIVKDKDDNYYLMRFDPPLSEDYFNPTYTESDSSLKEMV
ncbi:MAG: hypothetical protein JRJ54_15585 [Deltaproteobacteria bacterium]|nr:hypothetical protein [Deltaproteobacteria bacterium]